MKYIKYKDIIQCNCWFNCNSLSCREYCKIDFIKEEIFQLNVFDRLPLEFEFEVLLDEQFFKVLKEIIEQKDKVYAISNLQNDNGFERLAAKTILDNL